MSANEKKDIATILDQGKVPLEPSARAFLEQVIGRTTPTPPPNPPTPPPATNGLSVTGNQANGLSGSTKAGATIEAINISTAPGGRLHMDDTMVIGKADANGQVQPRQAHRRPGHARRRPGAHARALRRRHHL